jgi:hypothetical protein
VLRKLSKHSILSIIAHATRTYFVFLLINHLLEMSTKEIPRRRGVIRSSVTRLANRLSVLESKSPNQDTLEAAQQTLQRLNDLQAEFKVLHFELIDVIEDEKALEKEQEVFDMVDEQVDDTKIRIKKIIHNCSCSMKDTSKDELFFVTRKLSAAKGNLDSAKAGIASLTGKDGEIHLIRQYEDE